MSLAVLALLVSAVLTPTAFGQTAYYVPFPPEVSGGGLQLSEAFDPGFVQPGEPLPPFAPTPNAPPLGISFDGFNFDDNGTETGFRFIPPDPIAAAGTDRVIAVVNVMIEGRDKTGTLLYRDALRDFFAPLSPATFTFDPKVIYDQYVGRFVVVTLERQNGPGNPDPGNTSWIYLAVSKTSTPATLTGADWWFAAINAKTTIGGLDHWADYPGFAIDEEAVYVTNNMFSHGSNTYGGVRLWIVDKGAGTGGFYDGGAASVTVHDPYTCGPCVATTTQPAHVFGAGGVGPGIGTFLVAYSGLTNGAGLTEAVQVVRVDNPLGAPTFVQEFVDVGDIEEPFSSLIDAPQCQAPPPAPLHMNIEVNDRRALHAVWRNNGLWMTATVEPKAGPDVGQTTAHWFELDTTPAPALPILLNDQGDIGAEDIHAATFTYFPSIAVDGSGNAGIGFSASAETVCAGAYYTGRLATDPPGTVQPTGTLRAGLDTYQRTFGAGRNRWGDYSGISVDPSDDATFWVFNEYALGREAAPPATPPEDGRWGTAYGSFTFGTSPSLTIILKRLFRKPNGTKKAVIRWDPTTVTTNKVDFYVDEAPDGTPLKRTPNYGLSPGKHKLKIPFPGDGPFAIQMCEKNSTTVCSNILMADFTGVPISDEGDEEWGDDDRAAGKNANVPQEFALSGNYPNPFNPVTSITLDLPETAEVSVEVVDVLGRTVMTLPAQWIEAGSQRTIDVDGSRLASGTYLYRVIARTPDAVHLGTGRMILMK